MAVISNEYYHQIGEILTLAKSRYPSVQSIGDICKNRYVEAAHLLERTRHYYAQAYREQLSEIVFSMKDDECWALLTIIDDIETDEDFNAVKMDYSDLKKYMNSLRKK